MSSNQLNIVERKRPVRPCNRFSPGRFEGNQSEKKDVTLKNRSMSCPPARCQKDEESDEELASEENDKRPQKPRKRFTPSPKRPKFFDKKKESSGLKHPPAAGSDHRTQNTNVDGSGPGPSNSAPLRHSTTQTKTTASKRSCKPNRRFKDYFLFPITTNRTTTISVPNSSIAAPPPQKKLKFNNKPIVISKDAKKELIETNETNPLPAPVSKRGRGRPKKEQSADSQDSDDDRGDNESETEPPRKRGRPKKNARVPAVLHEDEDSEDDQGAVHVQQPPKKRGRPPRPIASSVPDAVKGGPSSTDQATHRQVDSDNYPDPEDSEEESDIDFQNNSVVVVPPRKRGRPPRRSSTAVKDGPSTSSTDQSTRRSLRLIDPVDGEEEEAAPMPDSGTDSSSDSSDSDPNNDADPEDSEKEPDSDSQKQIAPRHCKKPPMTLKEVKREAIDEAASSPVPERSRGRPPGRLVANDLKELEAGPSTSSTNQTSRRRSRSARIVLNVEEEAVSDSFSHDKDPEDTEQEDTEKESDSEEAEEEPVRSTQNEIDIEEPLSLRRTPRGSVGRVVANGMEEIENGSRQVRRGLRLNRQLVEMKVEPPDEFDAVMEMGGGSSSTNQTTRRSLRLNRQFLEVKQEPAEEVAPIPDTIEVAEEELADDSQERMEIEEPPTSRINTRRSAGSFAVNDGEEMGSASRHTRQSLRLNRQFVEMKVEPADELDAVMEMGGGSSSTNQTTRRSLRLNRQHVEVKQEPAEEVAPIPDTIGDISLHSSGSNSDNNNVPENVEEAPDYDFQDQIALEEPPRTRGRSRSAAGRFVENPMEQMEVDPPSFNIDHRRCLRSNRPVVGEKERAAPMSDPRIDSSSDSSHLVSEDNGDDLEEADEEPGHNALDEVEGEEAMRTRGFVTDDVEEMEDDIFGPTRETRRCLRSNGRAIEVKQEPVDEAVPVSASSASSASKLSELDSDDDEAPEQPEPVRSTRSQSKIADGKAARPHSNDLNADGTGPGCSSAPTVSLRKSSRSEDRNADGSAPGPSNAPIQIQAPPPRTPPIYPASTASEDEEEEENKCMETVREELQRSEGLCEFKCRGCEGCSLSEDNENMPLIVDVPYFRIPREAKRIFKTAKRQAKQQWNIAPRELAEVYRVLEEDTEARLPRKIHFSKFLMETTYGSPFPHEYRHAKTLYICEFCMFYAREDRVMKLHAKGRCQWRAPPGIEIYRKGNISIFEVDGNKQKRYCESLCLLSRCFLESKAMFWDTGPFLFYIITQNDEVGCHFAGYFSKQKYDGENHNLNCVMALPCYQKMGYGRFLIDVSYALSRREENWIGGPELPFSELGERAYASYWRMAVAKALADFKEDIEEGDGIDLVDITHATGINVHDVLKTLADLKWIRVEKGEKKKKKKSVKNISFDVDWKTVEEIVQQVLTSPRAQFDEAHLDWKPTDWTPEMDGFVRSD